MADFPGGSRIFGTTRRRICRFLRSTPDFDALPLCEAFFSQKGAQGGHIWCPLTHNHQSLMFNPTDCPIFNVLLDLEETNF